VQADSAALEDVPAGGAKKGKKLTKARQSLKVQNAVADPLIAANCRWVIISGPLVSFAGWLTGPIAPDRPQPAGVFSLIACRIAEGGIDMPLTVRESQLLRMLACVDQISGIKSQLAETTDDDELQASVEQLSGFQAARRYIERRLQTERSERF